MVWARVTLGLPKWRLLQPLQSSSQILNTTRRGFHASRRHQAPLLEACCSQTFELINALHSTTGLPWIATLPLTAIILRTVFVLPFTIWSRTQMQKVANVKPLVSAWTPILQSRVRQQNPDLGPAALTKLLKIEARRKSNEIFRAMGIKKWVPFVSLVNLPVWLLAMETIRRMCCMPGGLLSWVMRFGRPLGEDEVVQVSTSSLAVPSLADEGGLWISNLLVPDPMLLLPAALSVTYYGIVAAGEANDRQLGLATGNFKKRFNQALKLVALAMFPIALKVPSAMLVYWLSSALYGLVATLVTQRLLPLSRAVEPCRPKVKPYLLDTMKSFKGS